MCSKLALTNLTTNTASSALTAAYSFPKSASLKTTNFFVESTFTSKRTILSEAGPRKPVSSILFIYFEIKEIWEQVRIL